MGSDPGPGFCPLATGSSNMLDSSMNTPESWMMPLTLPSSKEVFLPVEQPGHMQILNSGMDAEVSPLSVAIAALTDLSHAGESTIIQTVIFWASPHSYRGPQVLCWAGCVEVVIICLNQKCSGKPSTI